MGTTLTINTNATVIADDTLRGVTEISDFIGEDRHRTYYLLQHGLIPAGKLGSQWIASKQRIREHYSQLTGEMVL